MSGRELRIREEIAEWEGITHVGGNYKVERNSKWEEIPESGEMHEWEEITEPGKVQEWERLQSAGKLQKCAKRRKVPGQSVVRLTLVRQSSTPQCTQSQRDHLKNLLRN